MLPNVALVQVVEPDPPTLLQHPSRPESQEVSSDIGLDTLGDQIAELSAHIHAATYGLLVMIREFDRRDGWAVGFRTCAHWLSWRTGINVGAAREKVRVARALEVLPRLSEGIRSGRLSYTKVRALTRVATPVNEEELVALGLTATAAQTEQLVRAWRRLNRMDEQAEELQRHESRFLSLRPGQDGMWELRGRLDPEVGAVVLRALEAAGNVLFRGDASSEGVTNDPEDRPVIEAEATGDVTPDDPVPTQRQRLADAVGLVAERALAAGFDMNPDSSVTDPATRPAAKADDEPGTRQLHRADRFQVVLHVEDGDLGASADPGGGELDDGIRVSAETSRRLSCDASKVVMRTGTGTPVLDVGRRTRTIPPAIRRALDRRDRCCRFPGCGVRFTDAHHVHHWADGGETRLNNLVLLCRRHHRAVHEEGLQVEMIEGQPRFRAKNGNPLPSSPPAPTILEDALAVLPRRSAESGLAVDPWTCSSGWEGEAFDVGFALDGLRQPSS